MQVEGAFFALQPTVPGRNEVRAWWAAAQMDASKPALHLTRRLVYNDEGVAPGHEHIKRIEALKGRYIQ